MSAPVRRETLVLLGSLYLSQGLPYGFFTQALPVLLRQEGMSLPKIGLTSLLFLPWALKFLWAPWIDRVRSPRFGHRRVVIVPLQLATAAAVLAMAGLGSAEATMALFVGVLLVNLLSATQDIATDGLAVESLDADARGVANGLQVGAYRIGMILGGGLLLWVFGRTSWAVAFVALGVLIAVATLPVLLLGDSAPRSPPASLTLADLRDALVRPGMLRWSIVLVTYKLGEWFATGMLKTFLTDQHLGLDDIGLMLGTVGSLAGFAGAMAGGWLVPRLGRRRALIGFGLVQAAGVASFALATQFPSTAAFYAVSATESAVSGLATAALFTAMMDNCRPHRAGTDYTLQACVVVVASGVGSALSGFSAGQLGYGAHFLVSAGLCGLGVAVVAAYRASDLGFAWLDQRR